MIETAKNAGMPIQTPFEIHKIPRKKRAVKDAIKIQKMELAVNFIDFLIILNKYRFEIKLFMSEF